MILWFRNDLRLHDNPAFLYALNNGCKKAVFLSTPKQWQQHNLSGIKVDLILRHVAELKQQLLHYGIELMVYEVDDFQQQEQWLKDYCSTYQVSEVIANTEVEVNEQQRDATLAQFLMNKGLKLTLFEADVIVPKGNILNQSGEMYKVFTPFKKAWLAYVKQYSFEYIGKSTTEQYLLAHDKQCTVDKSFTSHNERELGSESSTNHCVELTTEYITVSSKRWPLASHVEAYVIPQFLNEKLSHYQAHRDIPGIKGTSGLSSYLSIGAISSRYLLRLLLERFPDLLSQSPEAEFVWLNELIWREFYRHLLFHFPELCKNKNFNDKYDGLPWPNNSAYLLAWQEGRTGYPIVDAAMRQLNQTGWMHNRLRMIVGSFLTKHLLIDWRLGEKYFMSTLIDGDLAANNGGWQWCAGTGCDAQPYFRIFNPITQSERFDPEGRFIRQYLPELADVPNKYIHFPHAYIAKLNQEVDKEVHYWPAIVEHKEARLAALDFYKSGI